jgi:hypothetical protein
VIRVEASVTLGTNVDATAGGLNIRDQAANCLAVRKSFFYNGFSRTALSCPGLEPPNGLLLEQFERDIPELFSSLGVQRVGGDP